jgi:phosphomannomutase/phosphoglucomutase
MIPRSYPANTNWLKTFRAYDIRGIYGKDLLPKPCYDIGLEFAKFIGEKKELSIARDARLSSPIIESMVRAGILASGCDLITLGVQPTPILYFSIAHLGLGGGCMITASHNPPEYNGIKLCRENGFSLTYESGIQKIKNQIINGFSESETWNNLGKEKCIDIRSIYESYLKDRINFERELRIVIDAGNGTCGFVGDMLQRMGCKVDVLFADPDGRFPNHIPNPLIEETLTTLKEKVLSSKADLGIAFDGDGDRVGFVDEKGQALRTEQVIMIFAEELLGKDKNPKILFDVATSKVVPEYIRNLGGTPLMTRVGHSYVMEALHKERGKMAAENSGHYYFLDDYFGFDDGTYAAMKMIEILSRNKKRLSAITKLPHYFSIPEERIHCADEYKFKVIELLRENFEHSCYDLITIDGVRIETDDAWALVRASNTEPAIVTRFEGKTPEQMKKIENAVKDILYQTLKKFSKRNNSHPYLERTSYFVQRACLLFQN